MAPESGILLKILYGEKTVAKVDSTVALIGAAGEDISAYLAKAAEKKEEVKERVAPAERRRKVAAGGGEGLPGSENVGQATGRRPGGSAGNRGRRRVTKEDVEKYLAQKKAREEEGIPELEEVLPLVGIRKAIADGMSNSVRTAAHVTTIAEVDMTDLVQLRSEVAPRWKEEGINLTYVPFVIRAAVNSIREFPIVNSQILRDTIVIKKYINFGVVVAIKEGLITPVIKRVDTKDLRQIAQGLDEVSMRARERKLSLEDMRGGTITLSNPGVFGAVIATPIINQPQNAILWMGRIAKMPVVRDDKIVIRSMMYLCVSYDHRAIDGSIAAQFLQHIRRQLEDPRPLLKG